jgi:hypothetical protein
MVIRSGFEVHLVYADSKIPFKEFERDGKIYVEAEPDADYFISVQRVNRDGPPVIISTYSIDGRRLGYNNASWGASSEPSFQGIWNRINGTEQTNALRFAKPRLATSGDCAFRGGMGKVKIRLYEGAYGEMEARKDTSARDFKAAQMKNAVDDKKKFLLTTSGTTLITESRWAPGRRSIRETP